MSLSIPEITALLLRRGQAQYGDEAINQLQHALQCAHLAEQAGEDSEGISAALLHDLGHLIAAERDGVAEPDATRDQLHQFLVLPFLRPLFGPAVLEPIRLHVDAKRCLCTLEPGYAETLSPASQASLALQGGRFSHEEALAFMRLPHATQALRLRRHDDLAKVPDWVVPDLTHFETHLRRAAQARPA